MITINPEEVSTNEFNALLLGVVAPRPIAFASTVDGQGNVNLSPFSFFNVFGSNPPILIFSPSRRIRDNTTKHTFENIKETGEVVINVGNYPLVEQMSLSSTEYDKGVNEFVKAGFTQSPSVIVGPPRVAEAPACFECKVLDVIETGQQGGAGNLVICKVVMGHFHERIMDKNGKIDPFKLDAVARMGGNWYCRVIEGALFEIPKPIRSRGMGIDQLPASIRNSTVLTGNNLGRLGNSENLPDQAAILAFRNNPEIQNIFIRFKNDRESMINHLHQLAQRHLENGNLELAWLTLLQPRS